MSKVEGKELAPITLEDLLGPSYAFVGEGGGNPSSPFWLCIPEDNLGHNKDHPFEPYKLRPAENPGAPLSAKTVIERMNGIWPPEREQLTLKNQRKIWRLYTMIMFSFVTDQAAYARGTRGKLPGQKMDSLENKYEFFGKDRYGFLMSAFPLSFFNRNWAETNWSTEKCIKTSENSTQLLTYEEWTGLPSFNFYLQWVSEMRRPVFMSIREKYHPYVILCSGHENERRFFRIWTPVQEDGHEPNYGRCEKTDAGAIGYKWISNGKEKNATLIVVAPSFNAYPSKLNDPVSCQALGKKIRALVNQKYLDLNDWLQLEKFLPEGVDLQQE